MGFGIVVEIVISLFEILRLDVGETLFFFISLLSLFFFLYFFAFFPFSCLLFSFFFFLGLDIHHYDYSCLGFVIFIYFFFLKSFFFPYFLFPQQKKINS